MKSIGMLLKYAPKNNARNVNLGCILIVSTVTVIFVLATKCSN